MLVSPLQLKLTDRLLLKFKPSYYVLNCTLKISFPSILSTSLAMMLVAKLPIELISSGNGDICFKYHRTFLILSWSQEILPS